MHQPEARGRTPVVAAFLEETEPVKSMRERKAEASHARHHSSLNSNERKVNAPMSQAEELETNPLLTPEEVLENAEKEKKSIFLTGIVIGAGLVGGFFLARWIFSKAKSTHLEKVLETTY